MIFRQLHEADSSSYTYLLACEQTRKAALIDPVLDTLERDLEVLARLELQLSYSIETHMHADHLTSALALRERAGCEIVYPGVETPPCADVGAREGQPLHLGEIELHPLHTPGHTSHSFCYRVDDGTHQLVFTGDTLLIEGCGRTDFQSGDPVALYRSIHDKLFTLPDETLVYPGHDYDGRFVSSIAQEKARNPRLGKGMSLEGFVELMNGMDLPYPRRIDFAVPGNAACGVCPPNVPEEFRAPCRAHEQG